MFQRRCEPWQVDSAQQKTWPLASSGGCVCWNWFSAVETKEVLWPTVLTVTVTDTTLCSVSHTHTHSHTLVSKVSLNIYIYKKEERCHNLSFLFWYQCPILIHQWVYWLSLPVLSNLSQLLWLWLLPKLQPAPRLLRVILYGTGETETSGER